MIKYLILLIFCIGCIPKTIECECYELTKQEYEVCPMCHGFSNPCLMCNNTGMITCPNCGGDGIVIDSNNKRNICVMCNGSQHIICPKCQDLCILCRGKRIVECEVAKNSYKIINRRMEMLYVYLQDCVRTSKIHLYK